MSENKIKCPNCGNEFPIDEVLNHQAEERLNEKMKLKENELAAREREFEEKRVKANEEYRLKLEADRQRIAKEENEKTRKILEEEFDSRLKDQQEEIEKRKKENTELKQKELEFLKRVDELKEKEEEIDLKIQRTLSEERNIIEEKILKQEQEKNDQRFKELQHKLEQQVKLAEELQRKAQQGSMQIQGEVQEIALEALLKEAFPFDLIDEVGKGSKGADCIQTVRNNFGQVCGKIIYESKRTQAFSNEWIDKLKIDMRAQNADIGIIVTQKMPKEMEQFGDKNGIWICSYNEVRAVSHVLRCTVLKVFAVAKIAG